MSERLKKVNDLTGAKWIVITDVMYDGAITETYPDEESAYIGASKLAEKHACVSMYISEIGDNAKLLGDY